MAIKRNAEAKIIAKKFSLAKLTAAMEQNGIGFCLACGAEASCVEPDARGYKCESCEMNLVFGAEELMLRQFA